MVSLRLTFHILCLSYALLICFCSTSAAAEDDKKVYIVYMGALPSDIDYSPMSHHQSILQEVTSSVGDSLIRSYGRSFNGFVARLTEAESEKLAGMEGVVSVFPSKDLELQTTRSWDFMGFGDKIKHNPEVESDIIVGHIDSGLWPESKSFADEGFGPPPEKWKGVCKGGFNFTCNKKVIGARCYSIEGDKCTARDNLGHGTHTASTAAGNKVENVSFYGLARGTVRGGVPSARIATYSVCNTITCSSQGILAAFDDAIADGVDVITISIGGNPSPFEYDVVAIGGFHAMEKGILTVNSGGNSGPIPGSVGSISPWLLTVAASTTDRKFVTKVVLGNGKELLGRSVNAFESNRTKFPLLYGKTTSRSCSEEDARNCIIACLDKSVKGKILVCDRPIQIEDVRNVGDVGFVGFIFQGNTDDPAVSSLPASLLARDEYSSLLSYINSTVNPEGTILKSETIKDKDAPNVVSFSSRGPNTIVGDILKPDVTGPGLNIFAAYSPTGQVAPDVFDHRRLDYSLLSGTSMSCPHAAGVAAYVKTLHPDWSPSAIKSAIMTTAWAMNASSSMGANEFAYGSGHINPTMAADPGLVYEATREDYLKMLCALNYTKSALKVIAGGNVTCPQGSNLKVRDLNYPSMTARISPSSSSAKPSKITFSRTVTNVGTAKSTYKAQVMNSGSKLDIKVEPNALSFESLGEKKSFSVSVSGVSLENVIDFVSASLVWSDGSHTVRSPIVIYS